MKRILLILCAPALFAAGYLAGQHRPADKAPGDADGTAKLPRERETTRATAARLPPSDFPDRLIQAGYSEVEPMIGEIDPADLPLHIAQLLAMATPDGLDYTLKSAIGKMLARMMKEDPEGCVRWILGQPLTGNRDFLLGQVLGEAANKDWIAENFDSLLETFKAAGNPRAPLMGLIGTKCETAPLEAVRLSKELLRDASGEIDFPPGLGEACAKAGWQALFEYYKDSWSPDVNHSGWSWAGDFPKDFDFASFAAAWKEHEAGLAMPAEGRFYEYPEMLWRTWSELDPQAAYEFMNSAASRTFGLDTFLDGFRRSASTAEMLETTSAILAERPADRGEIGGQLISYLNERGDALGAFTREVEQGRIDPSLLHAVVGSLTHDSQSLERMGPELLGSIPADRRLAVIRQAHTRDYADRGSFQFPDHVMDLILPSLVALGHSESEVRNALSD